MSNCEWAVLELAGTQESIYSIQITGLQLTSQQSCKFFEKNICLFLVLVHQENFIPKVFVFAPVKCQIEYCAKKSTMHKL